MTNNYKALIATCVTSIHKVCVTLNTHPSNLTRSTWISNKLPTEPTKHQVQKLGGWAFVRREAAHQWDRDPTFESIGVLDTPASAGTIPPVTDPILAHRQALGLKILKRENKALIHRLADMEDSLEVLTALHEQTLRFKPITARETGYKAREATAVVMCSDWHVEETVSPEQVNGRNEYSPEIARERVRNLVQGILWQLELHQSKIQIKDLILWLGGDLISGFIHEELQETNAMSPIEATMYCQELIATELIQPILDNTELERILVPCSYGNHGRTKQRKQFKNAAKNSYEWLIYHALKHRFRDEARLEFNIANGAHLYVDVYDFTIRFHHGDDVKYGGGVGGLTIPINKAIDRWNDYEPADITCLGHFHTYMSLPYVVTNGSLIGYNEFALSIKAKYEAPQQAFFLVDSKRGKRNATAIWVEDTES